MGVTKQRLYIPAFTLNFMGNNPTSISDMEIYDLISDLNSLPYIETIFCCSGHLLWEERNGYNLPHIEYYSKDPKGYDLTKRIESQIIKDLPQGKPRVVPKINYYDDESLRFSGAYEGELNLPEEQMRDAVNKFWDSFRKGMKQE